MTLTYPLAVGVAFVSVASGLVYLGRQLSKENTTRFDEIQSQFYSKDDGIVIIERVNKYNRKSS